MPTNVITSYSIHYTKLYDTTPVKIDDYSYSMYIESMEMDGTPGDESIENNVKYIYSEAYGLTNADEIILYLPGYPVADLPEEFVMWSDLYTYEEQPETLPYYRNNFV